MDKETLLKEIEKAFPLRPLPNIIAGDVTPYEDEYSYVETYFKDKKWNSFTFKELYNNYKGPQEACLTFMSPTAFHYYLPGFICIVLNEYDDADLLVDTTLYNLFTDDDSRSTIFDKFTKDQIQVVVNFIQYMSETHTEDFFEDEINTALELWKKRLTHAPR